MIFAMTTPTPDAVAVLVYGDFCFPSFDIERARRVARVTRKTSGAFGFWRRKA